LGQRLTRLAWFCGLALSIACAGCGDGDDLPRQALSGTVTLDGKPLEQGIIQFRPASAEEPVPAGAEIKDGRYTIPRNEGPTPGNYRVFITSSGGRQPTATPAKKGEESSTTGGIIPDLIPPKYNIQSTLTAKVEAGKANTFDFPLEKK
jgi:hypothetical protein